MKAYQIKFIDPNQSIPIPYLGPQVNLVTACVQAELLRGHTLRVIWIEVIDLMRYDEIARFLKQSPTTDSEEEIKGENNEKESTDSTETEQQAGSVVEGGGETN